MYNKIYIALALSSIFLVAIVLFFLNRSTNNLQQNKINEPITPRPTDSIVIGQTCQTNGQCGAGKFCYQSVCRPANYCLSDSDCSIGAECQRVCQGEECNAATEKCGTLSLLNKNYVFDCFRILACKPEVVRCMTNGCQITGE
ncbi:hypothetical protein A2957_01940 [Candidatus Roizmanbacteria bacterium RIFCSPLOWO2_01_FULL_38_11]|uniref:Dickkopf N-terminal cysteine-rich domain-containing protein n=1 Tax=Candidatus Roizmanbacteria bacterium RIFCSPLOWO2_01_FULL_38_11 TaxID=1802060 RepID=A0A1F7ILL3_9BACT|nr:MAG: hypothetical protein A2957_01940 [Candidatus Roizmanbacteria bacterium RIFCSPLOWO2_01_FULL_38_11]